MSLSDATTTVTQLIAAPGTRVFGRDSIEFGSTLAERVTRMSSEQLEIESVDSDYVFQHRFGINRSKRIRQRLVNLAKELDLSDSEVRWMLRGGALRASRDRVEVVAGHWCLMLGAVHAAAMSWFCLSAMLVVLAHPHQPWRQLAASLVLGVTWLGTSWICDRLYLMPWRVWKDVRRSSGSPTHAAAPPDQRGAHGLQDIPGL